MRYLKSLVPLSLITLAWLLAACGSDTSTAAAPEQVSLQAQYSSAVADARTVVPSEISRYLTPISNDNPALIWENGVVGSRLLVVTWLGEAGKYYKCSDPGGCSGNTSCIEGGECPSYRYDSWVTVAPEIRNFFGVTRPEPLRIAQLLGLPPEYAVAGDPKEAKYMLELWVSPQDLFRPCPDTEISDTVCETSFPMDAFRMLDLNNTVRATEGTDYGVFKTYSSWFNNRTRNIYTSGSSPYPWTRLGYTYDWGSSNHTGLSEFVLHGRKEDGSTISVGIRSVKSTAEYFQQ
ncbi:MAG: hypothetical protein A2X82_08390 [Geobacteraceae bacterium GWC2_55_20]|nr:MAG: hypothetical protein A2X82_08390 [Geobacteraceae bacterium GWC2_55_20]OGU24704.1 MAG: hypothetical protein A2X85_11725 [Geobacteraceae bacterium GWF2_54_21]